MPRKKKLTSKEEESLAWYKDVLKKQVSKKASIDYDKFRKRIKPGEMLTFSYTNPKTPLKYLKWYDQHPVILIFNIRKNIHGINLHFVPKPLRETILKYVIKLNKSNIKSGKRFDLAWEQIKEFLHRNGLAEIVTKQYIIARMTNINYVKYANWKHAVNIPSEKFVFDGNYSHDDLIAMTRRGLRKGKKAKNVRVGRKT